ncbi:NERD domain-containing protein [Thauera aminoaromatica]|uniref:DNA 3'-5' helicase II n=1 Tax=Thauera aminoaromatica S2 TaxID=1234381 RepID=N6XLI7_THASP|nr:nuclease-related domain-containing DEAD/DEAH box helicase [Thauera aminoaromatica]ENO82521.1 NERD domain-containing protein [Thauera aminoaromatica S2]
MAQLFPTIDALRHDGGLYRELDVLERLQQSLPDGYEVFHSVAWQTAHHGEGRHGEIDLVVLAPSGNILLVEVKAGELALIEGNLVKLYGQREHDVARQTRVQHAAMLNRLAEAGLHAHVTGCVVLPDYQVEDARIVSMPRERIIDANDYSHLGTRVRELLEQGSSRSDVESLRRFLGNVFKVSIDLQVLGDQVRQTSRRLADGLATWVPRIASPSGVLRIQATAGSGKTQLALRLLDAAAAAGQRALYVCFNRTLADHIGHIAPARARVSSFHELCVEHWRRTQGEPDFTAEGIFQAVVERYGSDAHNFEALYDLVIIDEGQDFDPAWVASLLPQLKEDGRLYLLEDDAQRLYERDGYDLDGAVNVRCNENFRSPRAIVDVINALGLAGGTVEARSPYAGELPTFRAYDDERGLRRETLAAVEALREHGVPLDDIVVLSARGHGRSLLLKEAKLGTLGLRRFLGRYTADGEPVWSGGELLIESVHRFKGQSAMGVVLTEVDFEQLDEGARRRLFVGMTRAQLALEIVVSRAAEAALSGALA